MMRTPLAAGLAVSLLVVVLAWGQSAPAPQVEAAPPAVQAGFLGLPTQLMAERDAADLAMRDAEKAYHGAQLDFLLQAQQRQLTARYRELEAEGYWCMVASAVDVTMSNEQQRLWVGAGSRSGVVDGTIAMGFRGLVGRVATIEDEMCEVVLLTDPLCGVPVEVLPPEDLVVTQDPDVAQQRTTGAVRGGQPDGSLILSYIDGGPAVPGGTVVTSGEGDLYPPGIHVGEVIGHPLGVEEAGPASAQVLSHVDWPALREVLLVYGG